MKKFLLIPFFLLFTLPSQAQKLKFEYEIPFQYYFDNREMSSTGETFTPSMTIHSAELTPMLGLEVNSSDSISHLLMIGAAFNHDMGDPSWKDVFDEALAYYRIKVGTGKGVLEGVAGVYPRSMQEGTYSELFYSDSLKFYDTAFEGMIVKWRSPKIYAEFGLDWMGKYGYDSKERFQLFTAGEWEAREWLSLGWSGSFYHYACSEISKGVVDNHLFEPWIKASLPEGRGGWQELSFSAGLMASYQRDRRLSESVLNPLGCELELTAKRWNIMFKNTTYFGDDQMPFYSFSDSAGDKYGHNLYFGLPFYRDFYNRTEISWAPRITDFISLHIGARLHFGPDGFFGWQQVVSLSFDLKNRH